MKQLIYDILWTLALYAVMLLQVFLLTIWAAKAADSPPLKGYIGYQDLHKQTPKYDKRCPVHKGRLQFEHLRGLIGIVVIPETGQISYIYPESGLIDLGIQAGDYILEVNKAPYRPCQLPNISFYPKGSYIDLTISHLGIIRHVSVRVIDARNFIRQ